MILNIYLKNLVVICETKKLMKQKGVYPYECMDSFKIFFSEDKLPDRCELFSS